MKKLKVGDLAPLFKADSTSGSFSLENIGKQNIVLYFYPKDMTPGCTLQAEEFSHYYECFQSKQTDIIGISKDSIKSHKNFCKIQNIKYNLVTDIENKIAQSYGVLQEKSMFGKKYLGIVRSTFLLDKNRKIQQIWTAVKAKGHAKQVLNVVEKIMS